MCESRVATGFRAACHHVKGKCGIKQKVDTHLAAMMSHVPLIT